MDPPSHQTLQLSDPRTQVSSRPQSPEKQLLSPRDLDPLINLSPSSTVRLLRNVEFEDQNGMSDSLWQALKDVSSSERAFGLRAAIAASKIEEWCNELREWHWPGTFEEHLERDDDTPAEGSLPADLVVQLESRVEAIKDEYEELDLEELKSFVRNAHLMPSSRASSLYEVDIMSLSQIHRLDDFTALITATIMHALPALQLLNQLLDIWSIRLLVLHQIPSFLDDLDITRTAIDSAWKAIGFGTAMEKPPLSREAFEIMRSILQGHVSELGAKLDAMLDALEGQEDYLPEPWIEAMEAAQADCENWVVVAEREIDENEWHARNEAANTVHTPADEQSYGIIGEAFTISTAADTVHLPQLSKTYAHDSGPSDEMLSQTSASNPVPITVPPALPSIDSSPPRSTTSSFFSDVSEPQIMDASPIQIIKSPVEEKSTFPSKATAHPSPLSRHSSERTQISTRTITNKPGESELSPLTHHTRAASITSSLSSLSEESEKPVDAEQSRKDSHLNRASVASVELVPRRDIRNITITRNSSSSSAVNARSVKDENGTMRNFHSSTLRHEDSVTPQGDGPIQDLSPSSSVADLKVTKQRDVPSEHDHVDRDGIGLREKPSDFEVDIPPVHMTARRPSTLDDKLTARISSILTHIPANIRLKSGPSTEAPEIRSQASAQQSRTNSSQASTRASRAATPALTLAPAAEKPVKPKQNQEQSEIKLYHLHQPDKEQPIKLYVRLVGEGGERVMVRVGGGWADLGEYLKEYALHHGRRSTSDGKFGVISIPDTEHDAKARLQSTESGRITPDSSELPVLNRKMRAASGVSDAPPRTPEGAIASSPERTPGSMASARSGIDDDTALGLAGPKNKDVDLSPKKRAWVNGMLSQARQASAEKKRSSLSELGKVGSTRRFFRGKKND